MNITINRIPAPVAVVLRKIAKDRPTRSLSSLARESIADLLTREGFTVEAALLARKNK